MKNRTYAWITLCAAAAVLAGCGASNGPSSPEGASSANHPSKQGTTNAQAGSIQPPPNSPDPNKIMGSRG